MLEQQPAGTVSRTTKPGIRDTIFRLTNAALRRRGLAIERIAAPPAATGNHPVPEPCPASDPPSGEIVDRALRSFRNEFPIASTWTADDAETAARLSSFYWHYPFVFGDRLVEADWPPGRGLKGRHFQRYMHIAPALLSQTGGSLEGRSVLDLGCNCGFWSIQARQLGAPEVLGVEGSAENISQARLILELTGLDRIRYDVADITTLDPDRVGRFDVVLFLGLLYHLADPMTMLTLLAELTGKVAVIDTTVVDDRAAFLNVQADQIHAQNYRNPLAMIPSRAAVPVMLSSAGFRSVLEVPHGGMPLPSDYRNGNRVTFIALK